MPERIPQSTTIRVPLQAYLSSEHVSPATSKTIAITISKNGAAYGNPSGGATNATEIASGSYYVDLSATDTGTTGPLFVLGTASGVDNVVAIYNVVKATNGGLTALPDTACTTNASLITSGSGTDQLLVASGKVVTPDTQKVDVNTIKTQTVTCAAGVTIRADVGAAAAPGAANGMLIGGSNAATTFASLTCTGTFTISDGIVVTRSTANSSAVTLTGTGSGSGLSLVGGAAITTTAAGHGLLIAGGAASTGAGGVAGNAIKATGGAGAASANGAAAGFVLAGGGTNTVASAAHGFSITGTSTGSGLSAVSGGGATGDGITATAASTNGNGINATGTGTGSGILTDKLTASGAVAFQSTFAVTTSTSLAALSCTTLTASGAVAFQSTFAVTTSTSLAALSCTTLTASGAVAFQSTFGVTGTTSLAAVSTSGTVTFNAFTVSNATTLTGAVSAINAGNDIRGVLLSGTQTFNLTGNITGNLSGSVGSVTGAVGSVTGNVGGNVTGSIGSLATQAKTDVENAVWDATLASHVAIGSTGKALSNASAAGDPWATPLPGAYAAGTAGFILGTNLDAAVSTRGTSTLTQTQVTGGAYSIQSALCVLGDARIANLDATVSSRLAAASYTTPPTATAIADEVLTRDVSNVEASAGQDTLCGVVLAAYHWAIGGTTWQVYQTDGTTPFATRTLTATPGADPITGVA